ncbi:MAG: 50S ribosomal protein L24 [Candidatus Micrarchaeales archaeon]
MIQSSKPRYQRRFRFNAPMHVRQHFVHAHIDKALRAKLKITKKSIQIARGDTVKIMAGSKKGTTGKVTGVNLRTGRITLDALTRKTTRGKESKLQIHASNVYITELNLSDKIRAGKLKLAPIPQSAPKKEERKVEEKKIEEKKVEVAAQTTATNKM